MIRRRHASGTRQRQRVVAEAAGGDGAPPSEGPQFSLELNQDQKDIRDWVHGFAETSCGPPPRSGTSARRRPGR